MTNTKTIEDCFKDFKEAQTDEEKETAIKAALDIAAASMEQRKYERPADFDHEVLSAAHQLPDDKQDFLFAAVMYLARN